MNRRRRVGTKNRVRKGRREGNGRGRTGERSAQKSKKRGEGERKEEGEDSEGSQDALWCKRTWEGRIVEGERKEQFLGENAGREIHEKRELGREGWKKLGAVYIGCCCVEACEKEPVP